MKALKALKPYMLRRWRIGAVPYHQYFFTCARPGRTGDRKSKWELVPDSVVHQWVLGLPGPRSAIVSLLGCKPNGVSEFSFYSFYGGYDVTEEQSEALSFQEWLARWHDSVVLCEHPTCDFKAIQSEILEAIATDVKRLLSEGRKVTVVDSGGRTRTQIVCTYMCASEDSTQLLV